MRFTLSAALLALTLSGVAAAPALAAGAPAQLGPGDKLPLGGRPAERVAFPAIHDWHSLKITLSRTPCFGACPSYEVEIDSDGHVSYVGQSHVGTVGKASARISRAQVRRLYNAFRRAQFFWLYESYRARVTDLPSTRIGISYDGRSMQVLDYHGLSIGMPDAVADLEKLVDKTAGTARWVKGGLVLPRTRTKD